MMGLMPEGKVAFWYIFGDTKINTPNKYRQNFNSYALEIVTVLKVGQNLLEAEFALCSKPHWMNEKMLTFP